MDGHPTGYVGPTRSASFRTEVKDVGSSSLLVIQVHGSKIATSEERVRTGKSQIPPDLVVKFQPIDIVDVIL